MMHCTCSLPYSLQYTALQQVVDDPDEQETAKTEEVDAEKKEMVHEEEDDVGKEGGSGMSTTDSHGSRTPSEVLRCDLHAPAVSHAIIFIHKPCLLRLTHSATSEQHKSCHCHLRSDISRS